MEPEKVSNTSVPAVKDPSLDEVASGSNNGNGYTPQEIVNQPIPQPSIASEVDSSTLKTQSRQILGNFTFGKLGAIQIGNYVLTASGDIRISPDGIVGRNKNGDITFSIAGDTGDATFLGTLQAGTLIGGDSTVIIGVGGSGGGRILLYNSGIPQILIGDST